VANDADPTPQESMLEGQVKRELLAMDAHFLVDASFASLMQPRVERFDLARTKGYRRMN